jgi:hypothetical protein
VAQGHVRLAREPSPQSDSPPMDRCQSEALVIHGEAGMKPNLGGDDFFGRHDLHRPSHGFALRRKNPHISAPPVVKHSTLL